MSRTASAGLKFNSLIDPATGLVDYTRASWSCSSWSTATDPLRASWSRASWSADGMSSPDLASDDLAQIDAEIAAAKADCSQLLGQMAATSRSRSIRPPTAPRSHRAPERPERAAPRCARLIRGFSPFSS